MTNFWIKPISFPLLMLLVSFTACAQSSNLDRFYQKYQGASHQDKSGIEGGWNFSFTSSGDSKVSSRNEEAAGQSADDWFHKVSFIHCLSIDSTQTREWSDLSRSLSKDDFEEWVSVRHGKGRFQLLSRDGKDGLEDVVCLIVGKGGNGLFFHLRGHFTAADKSRIRAAFQEKDSDSDTN